MTCTPLIADNGFLQEMVDDGTHRYIRLILTDEGAGATTGTLPAELGFAAESFIRFSFETDPQARNGLTSKVAVREVAGGESFDYAAFVQRGWGRGTSDLSPDAWSLFVDQLIVGQDIIYGFDLTNYTNGWFLDTVLGQIMNSYQEIAIDAAANEKQVYVTRKRAGAYGRFCTSVQFFCAPITNLGNITLGGDTVTWNPTNELMTTWIADNTNNSVFGFQRFDNITTGTSATERSLEAFGPFAWDPILGDQPVFP